jgi:hypothetical protein
MCMCVSLSVCQSCNCCYLPLKLCFYPVVLSRYCSLHTSYHQAHASLLLLLFLFLSAHFFFFVSNISSPPFFIIILLLVVLLFSPLSLIAQLSNIDRVAAADVVICSVWEREKTAVQSKRAWAELQSRLSTRSQLLQVKKRRKQRGAKRKLYASYVCVCVELWAHGFVCVCVCMCEYINIFFFIFGTP